MKLQLFKGTYAVLHLLAMAGLLMMLYRQAGSGVALLLWLGLVVISTVGLVATQRTGTATAATALGLAGIAFLKWGGVRGGTTAANSDVSVHVDLALGVYLLLVIVLVIIWRAGRNTTVR